MAPVHMEIDFLPARMLRPAAKYVSEKDALTVSSENWFRKQVKYETKIWKRNFYNVSSK